VVDLAGSMLVVVVLALYVFVVLLVATVDVAPRCKSWRRNSYGERELGAQCWCGAGGVYERV
jgi:hypothetical protein